jgi:phosphopantetheinyl transferase
MNMAMIELNLLDVYDITQIDETGNLVRDLLPTALDDCATAEQYLEASKLKSCSLCCINENNVLPRNGELTEHLRSNVSRCIRVQDRYLRLLSVLIKSREFHLAYPNSREADYNLPIIDLPKSRQGKPFIPTSTGKPSEYEFSVSHQHPFVGIARAKAIKVGLDIVTFDEINHRLYTDELDFVNTFQSSFAKPEWDSIVRSTAMLKEFYLQWAIKEAYTKSLGLGMALEFKSFVTKLDAVENLWEYISENADPDKGLIVPATVQHCNEANPKRWCFFFLLLKSHERIRGCACACIPIDSVKKDVTVDTTWMKLEELILWHRHVKGM